MCQVGGHDDWTIVSACPTEGVLQHFSDSSVTQPSKWRSGLSRSFLVLTKNHLTHNLVFCQHKEGSWDTFGYGVLMDFFFWGHNVLFIIKSIRDKEARVFEPLSVPTIWTSLATSAHSTWGDMTCSATVAHSTSGDVIKRMFVYYKR